MSSTRHICRLLLVLLLPFIACSCHNSPKQFDPKQVAFSVEHNPIFDGQIYPAIILGTNNNTFGYQLSSFNMKVTSPRDGAVLRIVIDSSALNYVTIIQEILPQRGQTYTFNDASIKWKYDALRKLQVPGSVDLTFTCYINDEEVDVKNLHLAYRTANECPLTIAYQGQQYDFRWLFAAYVNEDHPSIEQILTDIIDQGIVTRLSGYQGGANAVREQVFAVWYYVLNRGIAYSSITCTSNPSSRANVQHIRFFDQVWNTRQANCVDACVFFASILRKIGLKPVIFVEPCHAYLGYYTDAKRKDIALLETTITAWANFPELERSLDDNGRLPEAQLKRVSKYLSTEQLEAYRNGTLSFEDLKRAVARSLFDKASQYNREQYETNRAHFADSTMTTYQQLDIEQLRSMVRPIN